MFYHLLNRLLPGSIGTRIRFYKKLSYPLSLKNPKTYNEKIHWRKEYDKNPLFQVCADKLLVRDYVKEKIGEEHLIPLLYSGDNVNPDTLHSLPDGYVVKANHNSGPVFIVDNKEESDLDEICFKVNRQLKRPYATKNGEWWYKGIPRKVIVEKLLKDSSGNLPDDYKFCVFNRNGEYEVVLLMAYDRHSNLSFTFYDENLEPVPSQVKDNFVLRPFKKPKNFELMVELAKKLAEDFDFCRVDLYNVDGEIYFGELTFAPAGGTEAYPYEFDRWMGDKWQLPKR
nr:ATP-grasp fold amidoligase family protein [Ferrimonas balearica]